MVENVDNIEACRGVRTSITFEVFGYEHLRCTTIISKKYEYQDSVNEDQYLFFLPFVLAPSRIQHNSFLNPFTFSEIS